MFYYLYLNVSNQSEEKSALMSIETDSCPYANTLDILKQGKSEDVSLCFSLSELV